MDNLEIYNKVRSVPEDAQKTINGGRLKGKTDINPMWRIKTLTEQFGACGIGWYYEITDKKTMNGSDGEIAAFVDINLYYKVNSEWSKPVPGTGGSAFIAKEKTGLYTSDECFKMALTDALSVACKALGIGANIYWGADSTKYSTAPDSSSQTTPAKILCHDCATEIKDFDGYTAEQIADYAKEVYGVPVCVACGKNRKAKKLAGEPPFDV